MSKVKFTPAPNKLLVKVSEAPPITKGGIHVPDAAKQRPMEGVVVAIGPEDETSYAKTATGAFKVEPLWKVKDHILFGKYDGVEVRIDEEDYLLLKDDQILGKRT